MKKLNILFILLLTLTSINLILAGGELGTQPCKFYGTITVNEDNTNLNADSVTAYVIGEEEIEANITYINLEDTPIGEYYIKVYNIDSQIKFRINGVDTEQDTQFCISGEPYVKLDLTAMITNLEGSFNGSIQSNIENLTLIFGESVQFKQGDTTLITFNYDFDSGSLLNLSAIKINKQNDTSAPGYIEISGITLSGSETKTVYIDKNIPGTEYVCILDKPDAKVSEMTTGCSGTYEIAVICDGSTVNGYTCTDLGDTLEIKGLKHSTVQESSYSPPSPPAATGGGGGGGGGATITTCTEDWSCLGWSECLDGAQTRVCTDSNSCGTFQEKPPIVQSCTAEEGTEGETPAPITGGVIGTLGTGGTVAVAVILIIIVIGLIIIVSRKKK